jgi:hypothetical protein
MTRLYTVANRFGAAQRMTWNSLAPKARCISGEVGYQGRGLLMTPLERLEFQAMEREGRRTAILADRLLSITNIEEA